MFEKIYLDPYYMRSVERIAFQERLCEPSQADHFEILRPPRNPLRKKTLLILTLFEKFEGFSTNDVVIERLADHGLCWPSVEGFVKPPNDPRYWKLDFSPLVYRIMKAAKRTILRTHIRQLPHTYYLTGSDAPLREKRMYEQHLELTFPEIKHAALNNWGKQTQTDLNELYDHCVADIYYWNSEDFVLLPPLREDPEPGSFKTISPLLYYFLESTFLGLEDTFRISQCNGAQIVSRFCRSVPASQSVHEHLEELACIAQTMLQDEIRILPNPSSLHDVFELRQRAEIARFRNVVSEWIQTIQEGRVKAEARIRRDIATANRDLRRLRLYKDYKRSPIAFWINAIGGHIPIFSNILTFVSTFGEKALEKWTHKHSGWATLIC